MTFILHLEFTFLVEPQDSCLLPSSLLMGACSSERASDLSSFPQQVSGRAEGRLLHLELSHKVLVRRMPLQLLAELLGADVPAGSLNLPAQGWRRLAGLSLSPS